MPSIWFTQFFQLITDFLGMIRQLEKTNEKWDKVKKSSKNE